MSVDENKALVRRWFEVAWNEHRPEAVAELLADDCVLHDNQPGQDSRGFAGWMEQTRPFREALPDLHFTVEDIVGEGDTVAARFVVCGTHCGEGLGPPTGKRIEVHGMVFAVVRDGKVAEGWNGFDLLSFFDQIGAVNRTGGGAPA